MKSASQQLADRERDRSEEAPPAGAQAISWMARALRRSWWIVALVVIVVGVVSYARFTREPVTYSTSQTLYIVVMPTGAPSNYDSYQASVWAETIGHALSEGRLTTVIGGFGDSINAQLAATVASGSDPRDLSSSQFQRDLSWSNYANQVVLTASWSSPGGASKLLSATVTALIQGNLRHVTIWRGELPESLVAHVITSGVPTPPQLDQQQQQAQFIDQVLAHLALSLPAGILLVFAWEWLRRWRSGQ